VSIDGAKYTVRFDGNKAVVNGKTYEIAVGEGKAASPAAKTAAGTEQKIVSPLPGLVLRLSVKDGDHVAANQTILVLEAMKMETEIKTQHAGVISFKVKQGDSVQTGTELAVVK
jgi:pyruvate carboxylase subunit B